MCVSRNKQNRMYRTYLPHLFHFFTYFFFLFFFYLAEQCSRYRGKVWFLLDVSENAKADSTSNPGLPNLQKYDILRDQIRKFAEDLNSGPKPQDVEIGIVSYTGNLQSNRATVRLTTPLTPVGTLASRLSSQQSYRLIPDGVLTNVSMFFPNTEHQTTH